MAFEPSYENLVSSSRKRLGVTQVVVESKLSLNEGTSVVKVLCANAKAYINGSEIVGKEVNFNGAVGFQVIYLDEKNFPQGMDYTAEFRDKYVLEQEISATSVLESNVVEVKYQVSGNDVKVVAIIEITIDGIISNNVDALVSVNSDNTFTRSEVLDFESYAGVAMSKFEVVQDIEIKDSVQKILSFCPSVFVNKVSVADKFLTLAGGINIDICYISDEEKSILRSYQTTFDFSEEIAYENINIDSAIQNSINIVLNEIKITTSLDANSAIVSVVVPINYLGYVFNKQSAEVVTDVFNITNDVAINYESVDFLKTIDSKSFEEKVKGNASIDDAMPFIDEVSGVCCNNVVLTNSKVVEDGIIAEGVASTSVLYFNKENNETNSLEVEIPFSMCLDYKDIPNGFTPIVNIAFGNVSAKSRRGKEIDVEGRIYAYVDLFRVETEAVISQVQLLDEKIEDDCALSIYIVKAGDTIWDIAKEMSVSPDMILEQNPELELPLKEGARVVIYRQKNAEF